MIADEAEQSGDDHEDDYDEDEERQSDKDFIADEDEEPTTELPLDGLTEEDEEELAAEVQEALGLTLLDILQHKWLIPTTASASKKAASYAHSLMKKFPPTSADLESLFLDVIIGPGGKSPTQAYKANRAACSTDKLTMLADDAEQVRQAHQGISGGDTHLRGAASGHGTEATATPFSTPCHSQSMCGLTDGWIQYGRRRLPYYGPSNPGHPNNNPGERHGRACRCILCEFR